MSYLEKKQNMLKPHDKELRVSWYVFWGQTGRPQTTGWKHIWLGAHKTDRDSPLYRIGLWASEENVRTLFIYRVKRLHTVSAGHYSDLPERDESQWNLWWLRASLKDFKKLCRIGKISTKTRVPVPLKLWPSPQLCPKPKWGQDDNDPTGSRSARPLSWVKMKLIWKSCLGPGWNRRDYCADCTNTVSLPSLPL